MVKYNFYAIPNDNALSIVDLNHFIAIYFWSFLKVSL